MRIWKFMSCSTPTILKNRQDNRGVGTLWPLSGSFKVPSEHLHTLNGWRQGEGKWLRVSAMKRSSLMHDFCKIGWCRDWKETQYDSSNTIRPRLQCPKFGTSNIGTARALCCTSGKHIDVWERITTTSRHFTQSWAGLRVASRDSIMSKLLAGRPGDPGPILG
jgi:hypothetical protein